MRALVLIAMLFSLALPPTAHAQSSEELFQRMTALADRHPKHSELHYHLGMFLNNGIGTERNPAEAYRHFAMAAEAGHPLAAFKVGCYHAGQFGRVVELDSDKAHRYKLRAAEAGCDLAQADVGRYLHAQGDKAAAQVWLERASRQGDLQAIGNLAYVLTQEGDTASQTQALALLQLLVARTGKMSQRIQDGITKIKSQLTEDEKRTAEQLQASWVTGPTPLSIEARQGIPAVHKMLKSLDPDQSVTR